MNALEKQVLKNIGEDTNTPDVFLNTDAGMAQIRDSLNHGIQQFSMATGAYHRKYFLRLREQCQFYRLRWNRDYMGYIVQAFDLSRHTRLIQTDLLKISREDPWWMKNEGYPERYLQIGYNVVGIYRKPSASNIVLELDCVSIPQDYTADTDPIKIREAFERGVSQFAVSEFHASRGDAQRATEWMNRVLETIGLKKLNLQTAERVYQFGKDFSKSYASYKTH